MQFEFHPPKLDAADWMTEHSSRAIPMRGVQVRAVVTAPDRVDVGMIGAEPDVARLASILDGWTSKRHHDYPCGGMVFGYVDGGPTGAWGPSFIACDEGESSTAPERLVEVARAYLTSLTAS